MIPQDFINNFILGKNYDKGQVFSKIQSILNTRAAKYHYLDKSGKISIACSKPLNTRDDLSLAYSPGVGSISELIHLEKDFINTTTCKGNLVAVISNGTAVLGLGNVGPWAAKPVMEGKSAIMKAFADIDSIDININESDPNKFIEIVKSLEPTFGGINLEDIKAPECFQIENELISSMDIPVMHDDQHGTAIAVCTALKSALKIQGKLLDEIKIIFSGSGGAASATVDLLKNIGVNPDNVYMFNLSGLLSKDSVKPANVKCLPFVKDMSPHTKIIDVIKNADVFIGLSGRDVINEDHIALMAKNPIVFALANPYPEIKKETVFKVRNDVIYASGLSDDINQINNLICFPYIFRGSLDAMATCINNDMKIACMNALSARSSMKNHSSRDKYDISLLPSVFDNSLKIDIPYEVFKAAQYSKVAKIQFSDSDYKDILIDKFTKFSIKAEKIYRGEDADTLLLDYNNEAIDINELKYHPFASNIEIKKYNSSNKEIDNDMFKYAKNNKITKIIGYEESFDKIHEKYNNYVKDEILGVYIAQMDNKIYILNNANISSEHAKKIAEYIANKHDVKLYITNNINDNECNYNSVILVNCNNLQSEVNMLYKFNKNIYLLLVEFNEMEINCQYAILNSINLEEIKSIYAISMCNKII